MLILVRHAMPAHGPDTPADQWVLSDQGHAQAAALTEVLPARAVLVASAEPKAYQTLEPTGTAHRDKRFNEIWRNGEPWNGNFRELRRAYVDGVDHVDWEPRDRVADRFDDGVSDHLARAAGRPLVIASHGMAMTLWLTERIRLPDPGDFWAALRFPDVHAVDLERRTITPLRH